MRSESTIYDPPSLHVCTVNKAKGHIYMKRSVFRDARSVFCMSTNTGYRLQLHLHGLQYSCRFQTVMQIEKTCFLSPFLSLSENHGVFAPMIFTSSTDRITSADATRRPKSIYLLSNRPSRGREETSAYHGSNGHLEGGVSSNKLHCHHALCKIEKKQKKKQLEIIRAINDAANAMQIPSIE